MIKMSAEFTAKKKRGLILWPNCEGEIWGSWEAEIDFS